MGRKYQRSRIIPEGRNFSVMQGCPSICLASRPNPPPPPRRRRPRPFYGWLVQSNLRDSKLSSILANRPHPQPRTKDDDYSEMTLNRYLSIGLPGVLEGRRLRIDGPDFEHQAAVQTGITLGDLRGFVQVVSDNEPIAPDHFLGFAKRAVRYRILPCDRFTFIGEPLSALHFPFADQSLQPEIELVDYVLYFIRRARLVPLSPGDDKVLGLRRSFSHGCLSGRLIDDPMLQENQRINQVLFFYEKTGCSFRLSTRERR
jgi:hypothetical protein